SARQGQISPADLLLIGVHGAAAYIGQKLLQLPPFRPDCLSFQLRHLAATGQEIFLSFHIKKDGTVRADPYFLKPLPACCRPPPSASHGFRKNAENILSDRHFHSSLLPVSEPQPAYLNI